MLCTAVCRYKNMIFLVTPRYSWQQYTSYEDPIAPMFLHSFCVCSVSSLIKKTFSFDGFLCSFWIILHTFLLNIDWTKDSNKNYKKIHKNSLLLNLIYVQNSRFHTHFLPWFCFQNTKCEIWRMCFCQKSLKVDFPQNYSATNFHVHWRSEPWFG